MSEKSPTPTIKTIARKFNSVTADQDCLYEIQAGIKAVPAFDELTCLVVEVRSAIEVAMHCDDPEFIPGALWICFRQLDAIHHLIQSLHAGIVEFERSRRTEPVVVCE